MTPRLDLTSLKLYTMIVFWINYIIGRFPYGIMHDKTIMDEIPTFFQRKLSAIKVSSLLKRCNIKVLTEISLLVTQFHGRSVYSRDKPPTWHPPIIQSSRKKTRRTLMHNLSNTQRVLPWCWKLHKFGWRYVIGNEWNECYDRTDSRKSFSTSEWKRLLTIVNQITTSNLFQSATDISNKWPEGTSLYNEETKDNSEVR